MSLLADSHSLTKFLASFILRLEMFILSSWFTLLVMPRRYYTRAFETASFDSALDLAILISHTLIMCLTH